MKAASHRADRADRAEPAEASGGRLLLIALLLVLTFGVLAPIAADFAKGGREQGESYLTLEVKRIVQEEGGDPCEILSRMLAAVPATDTQKKADIRQAQKYYNCRNRQKRQNR